MESFGCLRLALWDEDQQRLEVFQDARSAVYWQSSWSSFKVRSEIVHVFEVSKKKFWTALIQISGARL
jgi:hypothetical protein